MLKQLYFLVGFSLVFSFRLMAQESIKTDQLVAGEWSDLLHWNYWKEAAFEDFDQAKSHWQWPDLERYPVEVTNHQHIPIPNCEVSILNHKQEVLWKSKTDIDGRAELWVPKILSSLTLNINHAKNEWTLNQPLPYPQKNSLKIEAPCPTNSLAEIAFVVDATGSMKDEINFLKNQITHILKKAHRVQPGLDVRSGIVFYRDYEESFLVRKMDLTNNFSILMDYISKQPAAGGGDPTEAVEAALDTAIQQLSWSEEALSRILFLWMDGPPQNTRPVLSQLQQSIKRASEKGIKIVPLMASGSDPNTEFLLRNLAFQTNGLFTFLNEASGINPNHLVPVTENYTTSPLSDRLLKTISEQSTLPLCTFSNHLNEKLPTDGLQREDQLLHKIQCYPNPASHHINIELTTKVDKLSIQNAYGQSIRVLEQVETGLTNLNVSQWPDGIYFLYFQKDKTYTVQKIVVSKI